MQLFNDLAEKYVLASILCQVDNANKVYEKVNDIIKPEDFYSIKHRLIFQAIKELYDEGKIIDVVTVYQKLSEKKEDDKVEAFYLSELVELLPTSSLVEHYAKIVRELSIIRQIVNLLNNAILKIQISNIDEIKGYLKEFLENLKKLVDCLEDNSKSYERTEFDRIFDKIEIFFAKALNNPSTNFEKFVNCLFKSIEAKTKMQKERRRKS